MGVRECAGWAVRMEGGLEEHGRAVSKSQVGYLCVMCVMIMQGGGTWVWKTVEQGENVCTVYKACTMDMQGVGGSRDQWPRDIFEECMMTMKAWCFFFLATPCSLWNFSLGVEPTPSAVKALTPHHWTAREFPG